MSVLEQPRVLGLLVGNVKAEASGAQIKYGHLFDTLRARTELVDVADVELYGGERYQNALRTVRWPARRWREAFHKNIWAFHARSRKAHFSIFECLARHKI